MFKTALKLLKYVFAIVVVAAVVVYISSYASFGKIPDLNEYSNAAAIQQSQQWNGERFRNKLAQEPVETWQAAKAFFFTKATDAEPEKPLAIPKVDPAIYQQPPASGLRVTWLGHSILLLEVDGRRVLVDPVWSQRASPLGFFGTKRFFPSPLALKDIPPLDAVLISHDHYDHLDMDTVKKLSERNVHWYVPLGVGSHLEYWGVDPQFIHEMDWWQTASVAGLELTAIPSRHGSGRSAVRSEHKRTLWSGWVIKGAKHSVVYSGDTSMHEDFLKVGEQLGPFDLSIIEIGAYNPLWRDNHLGPEQALIAHQMLAAKKMLPVHWAGFNLSQHAWTAPIERLIIAAEKHQRQAEIILSKPGVPFEPALMDQASRWWPELPFADAAAEPVWSTKVDKLLAPYRD